VLENSLRVSARLPLIIASTYGFPTASYAMVLLRDFWCYCLFVVHTSTDQALIFVHMAERASDRSLGQAWCDDRFWRALAKAKLKPPIKGSRIVQKLVGISIWRKLEAGSNGPHETRLLVFPSCWRYGQPLDSRLDLATFRRNIARRSMACHSSSVANTRLILPPRTRRCHTPTLKTVHTAA